MGSSLTDTPPSIRHYVRHYFRIHFNFVDENQVWNLLGSPAVFKKIKRKYTRGLDELRRYCETVVVVDVGGPQFDTENIRDAEVLHVVDARPRRRIYNSRTSLIGL